MRNTLGLIAAIAGLLSASLAGATPEAPPPTPGTISVEATAADRDVAASVPVYLDAVGKALSALGFTVLDGVGHASLVAEVHLSRVALGTTTAKVPASKAAAGPGGAYGVGGSVSLPLPTSASRNVPLLQTRLEIRVEQRGDNRVIWQAAAITVRPAETRQGRDEIIAADLAQAMLRGYPAQPDEIVSVP